MHHARARYCMEAAVAPHGLDRFSSAAVSDFITHVVYVHDLTRYKREVRIYGDHCTVVVVRLVPPLGTPRLQRGSGFRGAHAISRDSGQTSD